MRRQLLLISIVPVILMVGGAGAVAGAEGPGRLHTTVTQSDLSLSGFDNGVCAHSDLTTNRCAIPFYGTDVFSGDLVGTEQNAGGLSVDGTFTGYAVSVATYSGTVKGCPGPGTAVFRYVFEMGDPTPGTNTGTVDVVAGSGTGGLAALRGQGDNVAHATLNGVVSAATLNFSCNGHRGGD